jgi:hypothetical protein
MHLAMCDISRVLFVGGWMHLAMCDNTGEPLICDWMHLTMQDIARALHIDCLVQLAMHDIARALLAGVNKKSKLPSFWKLRFRIRNANEPNWKSLESTQ